VRVSGERVTLCNSGPLDGLELKEARDRVMQLARDMKIGGYPTSSNLQDWLISRQRYWTMDMSHFLSIDLSNIHYQLNSVTGTGYIFLLLSFN
jgi:leucyl-tRNA synthetase